MWLTDEGFDPQYGARPLKRVIQRDVVNALSKKLLAGEIDRDSEIHLDMKMGEVIFEKAQKVIPA